jgi:hypothetical protein
MSASQEVMGEDKPGQYALHKRLERRSGAFLQKHWPLVKGLNEIIGAFNSMSRPGQPEATFGAILALAGRAAHLEAVRRMLATTRISERVSA